MCVQCTLCVPQAQLAAAAPSSTAPAAPDSGDAQAGLDAFLSDLKKSGKQLYDRVYYGDVFPPTGSFQLSYARLLELLAKRKVKRIALLSDGRACIVEVPVENTESDFSSVTYDRRNYNIQYAEEVPEWKMEKNRYYCELPGDVWEEGTLMELIKSNQERRVWVNGQQRVPYDNLLRLNEVRPELAVVDPGDAYVWLNQYSTQFLPIVGLLALRLVVGAGDWVLRKLGREKKSAEQELADQLGKHRAKTFNVDDDDGGGEGGGGAEGGGGRRRRDTGVRYDDVAGIDAVKEDIRVVLDILLGEQRYKDMGAHPVRVSGAPSPGARVCLVLGPEGAGRCSTCWGCPSARWREV
jgi:cell division protease FtsH